jgi:hypothetical protein
MLMYVMRKPMVDISGFRFGGTTIPMGTLWAGHSEAREYEYGSGFDISVQNPQF